MPNEIEIGMTVSAQDGDAGVVEDILFDKDGAAHYLVVRDKGVFGSDSVLPIAAASVQGSTVRVAMTRAEVHGAASFNHDTYGEAAGLFSQAARTYDQQA